MYAEYFSVGSWLEEPAKYLQWAVYGLNQQSDMDSISYNLGQFWKALASYKAQASTPQQWGDILTLDARSHYEASRYWNRAASLALQGENSWFNGAMSVFTYVLPLVKQWTPDKQPLAAAQSQRANELNIAGQLQGQAKAAYAQAGIQSQTTASASTVYTSAAKTDSTTRAFENKLDADIRKPPSILDAIKTDWFGVPLWVWLAGGAALLLLLEAGPSIAAASAARRYAEAE